MIWQTGGRQDRQAATVLSLNAVFVAVLRSRTSVKKYKLARPVHCQSSRRCSVLRGKAHPGQGTAE